MIQSSPYHWLSPTRQNRLFIFFFILTVILMAALQILDGPLRTDAAPNGIVSYEFAGDLITAQQIIQSWGIAGLAYAGLSLGLDFLFMAVYPIAIGLGCVMVGRRWLPALGNLLAWGLLAAGLLDAVENIALIQILLGAVTELWPTLARWSAIPKFTLVAAGLFFVLLGAVGKVIQRQPR